MRDVELLHPELKKKCLELIKLAKEKGIEVVVTDTLRTEKEQNELYAKGRTKPGPIVTDAKYPYSLHCWGLAFDVAVVVDGKPNWTRTDLYEQVGKIGKSLGLVWGGDFKNLRDMPHFQLPGYDVNFLIKKYQSPERFIATFEKPSQLFVDIKDHWAKEDIEWLLAKGIVQAQERFRPNEPLTRAEAAVLVRRALEYITLKMEAEFKRSIS